MLINESCAHNKEKASEYDLTAQELRVNLRSSVALNLLISPQYANDHAISTTCQPLATDMT